MKTQEELQQMIGKKITCKIHGSIISDAKLQFDKDYNKYYICQNNRHGEDCHDKLGYRYSWTLGDNNRLYTEGQLTHLELAESEIRTLPIFN